MRLSWPEIRANAARFSEEWQGKGYEKGQTQSFYDEFFAIFGVPRKQVAVYEQRVKALDAGRTGGFIDLFWPGTLIVEQKSRGRDLTRAMSQALDYYDWLPEAQRPRYMMVCDFQRFELVDLQTRQEWRFALADLKRHVEAFGFILGVQPRLFKNQSPVNRKASELMGRLHNALAADGYVGHDLERLLVRLLFILFADDTGIFERKDQFLTFLEQRTSADGRDLGRWLGELFQVLDTPPDQRQRGLDADLAEFPYINGELFRERIAMPAFDNAMRDMLLDASMFNWGEVSPAIFGSLFESVIDTVTRRKQGAHYTPEQAILKVIEPLFLDELRAEFERAKALKSGRARALSEFHEQLGALTFLDPACGAGNFLVVAYRELRELEREVIKELHIGPNGIQQVMDVKALVRTSVEQFHGIEVDEFPALIAQVALWMTDHIANTRLGEVFGRHVPSTPLVTTPGICHADALEIDWNEVLPAERCTFVFGNPPFLGKKEQSAAQKGQVRRIFKGSTTAGEIDFVACWFLQAAEYQTRNRSIRFAFIATNSVSQGEQVAAIWPHVLDRYGLEIFFAHRTFEWISQSRGMAHVHVVVIGLTSTPKNQRRLFDYAGKSEPNELVVDNINAYLTDGPSIYVKKANQPLSERPRISKGSEATDFGHLTIDAIQRARLLEDEDFKPKWLRMYVGGDEFINGDSRWCLWLKDAVPAEIRKCRPVTARLHAVTEARRQSDKPRTRRLANFPALFGEDRQPVDDYLIVPKVSSQRRDYIPIGTLSADTIVSGSAQYLTDDKEFTFGLITSRMHMAWMRAVGGRTKSDYQYSNRLVYNTFPWPDATPAQRAQVEALAQGVLDARAMPKNATSTLADLYDPDTMPAELRRAHRELDGAVDRLYRRAPFGSDRERVEHLFTLYQRLVDPLQNEGVRQNKRVARRAKTAPEP